MSVTAASAVIEGPGAIFGWGAAKLFHAGMEELGFYHATEGDARALAHATAAQAYFLAALAKSDQDIAAEPSPGPESGITRARVTSYLMHIRDGRPAGEQDAFGEVLAVLTEDPLAASS